MIGYWISFGLLFPLILFGCFGFKILAEKNNKVEITPEMDAAINRRIFGYIVFYWLCNLFYMSCFINNLICKYIFGGFIMLDIFMNLARTFSYPKDKTSFMRWGLLQDFIVGVGLSIYLIYIIPNTKVKEIVIPIIAAIYGGLITLVGVAWTIRKSDIDKNDEEVKKAKPLIFIVNKRREQTKSYLSFTFENSFNNETIFTGDSTYHICPFFLKNADYSFSYLKGICINNDIMLTNVAQVFDKGQTYACICDFEFSYNKEINNMYLLLVDMLDNFYALEINFECSSDDKNDKKDIGIISGIETFKVEVNFDNFSFTKVSD